MNTTTTTTTTSELCSALLAHFADERKATIAVEQARKNLNDAAASLLDSTPAIAEQQKVLAESVDRLSKVVEHYDDLLKQLFAVSQAPLVAIGKVLTVYRDDLYKSGGDNNKQLVDNAKTSLERALKRLLDVKIVGTYDRSAKVYTFAEKQKTIEDIIAQTIRAAKKEGYSLELIAQALLENHSPVQVTTSLSFDDLI